MIRPREYEAIKIQMWGINNEFKEGGLKVDLEKDRVSGLLTAEEERSNEEADGNVWLLNPASMSCQGNVEACHWRRIGWESPR